MARLSTFLLSCKLAISFFDTDVKKRGIDREGEVRVTAASYHKMRVSLQNDLYLWKGVRDFASYFLLPHASWLASHAFSCFWNVSFVDLIVSYSSQSHDRGRSYAFVSCSQDIGS